MRNEIFPSDWKGCRAPELSKRKKFVFQEVFGLRDTLDPLLPDLTWQVDTPYDARQYMEM